MGNVFGKRKDKETKENSKNNKGQQPPNEKKNGRKSG